MLLPNSPKYCTKPYGERGGDERCRRGTTVSCYREAILLVQQKAASTTSLSLDMYPDISIPSLPGFVQLKALACGKLSVPCLYQVRPTTRSGDIMGGAILIDLIFNLRRRVPVNGKLCHHQSNSKFHGKAPLIASLEHVVGW